MTRTPRAWFRFSNQAADPTVVDINVVDIIGDWIDELINEFWGMKATLTAKAFIDQLSKLDANVKTIRVHINSPGGDVFAAVTIANALRDQQISKGRTVDTFIDGLAASAASIIAMAGQTVTIADNALLMIHKPLTGLWGNAHALRAAAAELDTIELNAIVQTYKWHSSLSDDAILALLNGENGVDGTWMGADEAVEKGFATAKAEGLQAAASIDPKAVATLKVPEQYRARVQSFLAPVKDAPAAPATASHLEIFRECHAAGCDDLVEGLVAANATAEQVTAKVSAAKAAKAAEATRVEQVTAICARAKLPTLAEGYITGGMSVEGVKAHVAILTAVMDKVEIDGGLHPDQSGRKASKVDAAAALANFTKTK